MSLRFISKFHSTTNILRNNIGKHNTKRPETNWTNLEQFKISQRTSNESVVIYISHPKADNE